MSSVKYNVLGLIFASMHDSNILELSEKRTFGSVPFGGRYRLVDFPLSNLVNSGVAEVGILTKQNYASLLDHIGTGRDWDLARKRGGLHLLPPFSQYGGRGVYGGRLDALRNVWSCIEHSPAEYVILANCDVVTSIDYTPAIKQHIDTRADITLIYGKGMYEYEKNTTTTVLEFNENNTIKSVLVNPKKDGECNQWLETLIISKNILDMIIHDADTSNAISFTREILQNRADEYKIMGYKHDDFFAHISSIGTYYSASMALLDANVRNALFKQEAPVFTKVRDSAPTRYSPSANIKNSLIADGCVIEGTVENSVIFRGVKIGKGSVVKDSILMQGTVVGEGCNVINAITDKNAEVLDGHDAIGSEFFSYILPKNAKL